MPSSAKDRFTVDFEDIFFFTKSTKYYFEQQLEPWKDTNINDTKRAGKFIKYGGKNEKSSENKGVVVGNPELGRNKRCVWTISTHGFSGAHFATYPETLVEPMLSAGCPVGGVVLDPFFGAGTTGAVAKKQKKNYLGIEMNPEYIKIAEERIGKIPNELF